MVFTRNQKRKVEDDEENTGSGSNGNDNGSPSSSTLQVNNVCSNISLSKRKKLTEEDIEESENECSFVTETDTESDDISITLGSDDTDNFSEKYTEEPNKQEDNKKVLNLKLNQTQIQEIIKEAIQQLVKKHKEDDQEFIKDDDKDKENPYNQFTDYLESVYSGKFFERIPIEDKIRKLKTTYSKEEIENLNNKLQELQNSYKESAPSIIDILNMKIEPVEKQKLLEKLHVYTNSEILTNEYTSSLKYLLTNINNSEDESLIELEKKILNSVNSDELNDNYKKKILKSNMSFENKVIAYKRHEVMDTYADNDNSEYAKYKNWMDTLLSVPFGSYLDSPELSDKDDGVVKTYLKNVREVLDRRLSFLEKPKDQIINIVTQTMRNPDFPINAIGLSGCKGIGKTSIIKSVAEALNRPYKSISLGGESDASMLTGHGFTYIGSNPGRLIEILRETKCMNPIVLIDELDKVSQTHQGKEIIGTLIHLTDSTTNNKYNYDRYFAGVEFDLSKVLFVFTYNDPSKVDKILLDRLYKINIDNYTHKEKLEITNKHLIQNILDEYKLSKEDVNFTVDAVSHLVNTSKLDEGMRDIKRKFEIIISRINTLILTGETENNNVVNNIIKLKYKSLSSYYTKFPVLVPKEHIDILLEESINGEKDSSEPPMGMYL